MRRFLIVCLCVVTVGCVVLLLAGRGRGPDGRFERVDRDVDAGDASPAEAEEESVVQQVPGAASSLADRADRTPDAEPERAGREAELALERLVRVRADLVAGVERRSLYVMAHERGLPNHALYMMTSEQLLEAILEAEGLPPADVLPSQQTEERVMAVADEAYRRDLEYRGEQAAERDAG